MMAALSALWHELSDVQRKRLLAYVQNNASISYRKTTMADLPFIDITIVYWAIPVSDDELWGKLRPHTPGAGLGRGS